MGCCRPATRAHVTHTHTHTPDRTPSLHMFDDGIRFVSLCNPRLRPLTCTRQYPKRQISQGLTSRAPRGAFHSQCPSRYCLPTTTWISPPMRLPDMVRTNTVLITRRFWVSDPMIGSVSQTPVPVSSPPPSAPPASFPDGAGLRHQLARIASRIVPRSIVDERVSTCYSTA